MKRIAINHANFDSVIDNCKNGLCNIAIFTAYRTTLIKGKHLKQWDNAGQPLLEKDDKSEGFYMRRGKNKDYIFPPHIQPILFAVPA